MTPWPEPVVQFDVTAEFYAGSRRFPLAECAGGGVCFLIKSLAPVALPHGAIGLYEIGGKPASSGDATMARLRAFYCFADVVLF